MIRKLSLCCWVFCLWLWPWPSPAQTVKYDLAFKRWGQFYLPWQDWRWWRAQGMAESGLNQASRSACGAIGVMQLMAPTARGLGVNPYDAEANIQGGIKYDASLLGAFAAAPDAGERRNLAFAGYNAGPGNIERALRAAQVKPPSWAAARGALPRITGPRAAETIG